MKCPKIVNPDYMYQQALLRKIAYDLGVVCFYPNYHGEKGDKNTVLFYTKEDAAFNRELEMSDYVDSNDYKRPFWAFENTDVNGLASYSFANFGKVGLRIDPEKALREAIDAALKIKLGG